MTENDVKKQVKQYLRINGWFVFHVLQGLGCYPGISDFIAVKNGRVVFIECKKPKSGNKAKGNQSKHQIKFQNEIENAGSEYILAYGIEEVEKLGSGRLFKQKKLRNYEN